MMYEELAPHEALFDLAGGHGFAHLAGPHQHLQQGELALHCRQDLAHYGSFKSHAGENSPGASVEQDYSVSE